MNTIPYKHPAWAEIDLAQFKRNLAIIKKFVGVKLCLPVKANAYGHGLVEIARAASESCCVDYLGVSCLQEGIQLREAGIKLSILVFGAVHEEQLQDIINYNLDCTISSLYKAKLLAEVARSQKSVARVHLEVDTGMNRTGMRVESAREVLHFIQAEEYLQLDGVYSHLADADNPDSELARLQISMFRDFVIAEGLLSNPTVITHIANSGGVMFFRESHLEMVRPGLLSFGYLPVDAKLPNELLGIKPCFSVHAKVSYFKVVTKGSGVSYNHKFRASEDTRVITIPMGYGDGLRRDLSNKGRVLLGGKFYPMIGSICMDQFMVDIGQDSAYVGDTVTIIGRQGSTELPIAEQSRLCNSIDYEILCGFNNRLPRIYK